MFWWMTEAFYNNTTTLSRLTHMVHDSKLYVILWVPVVFLSRYINHSVFMQVSTRVSESASEGSYGMKPATGLQKHELN